MIPLAPSRHRLGRPGRPDRAVRRGDRARLHGHPLPQGRTPSTPSTSGAWAAASSAPGSPGSCSAATSTRRTRSSPCRRRCSRWARSPGFFAVPYTIILYPIIFIFMARLWSVSHRHGYVTTADFVRGRYDSRVLSLAVAVTGFVATMPYIALQLVGIQAVLEVVGLGGGGNWLAKDLPLLIAFVLLAAYTYTSGLRAPGGDRVRQGRADLPRDHRRGDLPADHHRRWLGGASSAPPRRRWPPPTRPPASRTARSSPATGQMWAYATLALGSAMALFMYPALGHRDPLLREPHDDPAQRLDPAGVLLRAGPAGPARLGGDRGRHASRSASTASPTRSW